MKRLAFTVDEGNAQRYKEQCGRVNAEVNAEVNVIHVQGNKTPIREAHLLLAGSVGDQHKTPLDRQLDATNELERTRFRAAPPPRCYHS